MPLNEHKVFGVGLSKTGTTSLAKALETLGYRTLDYPGATEFKPGDLSSIDPVLLETYDAFTDTPIPSLYRELDKAYPNAKFILTVRETESWLKSCKKQFTKRQAAKMTTAEREIFIQLYGCTYFQEGNFRAGYDRFVRQIETFFKYRKADLLVIDICGGQGWEKLCTFLNKPVPLVSFPATNVTAIEWINVNDIIPIARDAAKNVAIHLGKPATLPFELPQLNKPAWPASLLEKVTRRVRSVALTVVHRNETDRFNAARASAHRTIVKGLANLNAQIPIVSPQAHIPSDSERKKWNHFWLINALTAGHASEIRPEDITINIALIEQGQPIVGVVYAPFLDTLYYAKRGLGSFKWVSRTGLQKLESVSEKPSPIRVVTTSTNPEHAMQSFLATLHMPCRLMSATGPLSICLVAEGKADIHPRLEPTMEWDIAAAHAIVKAAGKNVYECNTMTELYYNKVSLRNNQIVTR